MKFFAVLLMTTLVCFIHASKFDEPCSNHKECGRMDLGCFENKCQWVQNYLSKEEVRDSYSAKELGDPCVKKQQCSSLPTAICQNMACVEKKKYE